MELTIYDTNLDLIGILDTATDIIWHRVFHTAGDFEIHVPVTSDTLSLLKPQFLITKKDTVEFGIIECLVLEQSEAGESLKVTGRFGSSLLDRRIIFETQTLNTTVEVAMRSLVSACCITPTIPDRIIPQLELGPLMNYPETINIQVTYKNLLLTLRAFSETSGIGFRVRFIPSTKKFRFETFKPFDRSFLQSENPRVIFSNDYDNLLTSTYKSSDQERSNLALVGGEGVGEDRKLVLVGSQSGLERREIFVNAKDQRLEEGMSLADYNQLLAQKGSESLVPRTEYFEGTVLPNENVTYKTDYDLGDIVTIENSRWDKRIHVRINEITEVSDENGETLVPVFGQSSPSISNNTSNDTSGTGSGSGPSISITPNKAVVSDVAGSLIAGAASATEISYMAGVTAAIQTQFNNLRSLIYPIGSLYLSVVATSPAVLFGGTWVQISDSFLLAAGSTYGAGTSGGVAAHNHTSAAHNHAIAAHSHASAAHAHSIAAHSHSSANHSHSVAGHAHSGPSHAHGSSGLWAKIAGMAGGIAFREDGTSAIWAPSFKVSGTYSAYTSNMSGGAPIMGSTAAEGTGSTSSVGLTTDPTTPGNTGGTSLTSDSTTPGNTGGTALTSDATTPGATGSSSNLPPYLAVLCLETHCVERNSRMILKLLLALPIAIAMNLLLGMVIAAVKVEFGQSENG